MSTFYKVDESSREIVNIELWGSAPSVEGFLYVNSDSVEASIGDKLDSDGNVIPFSKPVALVSAEEVRTIRDELLNLSDYTQIPDYPISDDKREEWKTYRQALRDMTEGYVPVESPQWPAQPE